jgi:hypothetical protein
MVVAFAPSTNAGTLKGATSATVTGARPGQVLWTNYHIYADDDTFHERDSIIRLINPNGGANTGITGITEQPVCAMTYVFDSDEEMEACCGCPISSAGLLSFSVIHNLVQNGVIIDDGDVGNGVVAVVAAAPNPNITTLASPSNGHDCTIGQSGACNSGCDPTNIPGYAVTTSNNLLGSRIIAYPSGNHFGPPGLTEVQMFDDGSGDPANLIYLQNECGQLVGNGSGAGICSCPAPGDAETTS